MVLKELVKKLIPKPLLNVYHFKLALLGAFLYGFPGKSKKIRIIGVTGTSGKSTVVDMASRILEETGNKVASFSSVRFKIGQKEWKNELKMTMPGRFKVQKFLRQAIEENCQFAVLEITSEGIRQSRHRFIDFDAAVFTNLSPEHIESHGSFENYRNEKLKLFKAAKNIHIINIDDQNAGYFLNIDCLKNILYGINNSKFQASNIKLIPDPKFRNIFANSIKSSAGGISFSANGTEFNLKLLGEFNVYNALSAICIAIAYGIDLKTCKEALEKVKGVSGRMEVVLNDPFRVVVDYAHTPVQLEGVYKAVLNSKPRPSSSMICVLGSCGGGRDKWKRPVLGKIAGQYCDKIIITNEDPYDEDPDQILSEIKSGISQKISSSNFYEILDREEAIKTAVKIAQPGDVVVITGKGCEPWMCLKNGKKIPWDDREIARKTIA